MKQYIGFWQRASIQIGAGEPFEDTTVYWLQAETYFADIRIPFNQPSLCQPLLSLNRDSLLPLAQISAFAGRIDCTETWIRWNRRVDFKPSSEVDQGQVQFAGANLIERGESIVNGEVEAYTEVWVPQPTDCDNRLVLELVSAVNLTTQAVAYPKGLWVIVGSHAIRLCDQRGYPPDLIAPDPAQLSEAELKQLMQFEADYGQLNAEGWQVRRSADPTRVGKPLQPPTLIRDGALIETQQVSGEAIEYCWEIREAAGALAAMQPIR